MYAETWKQCVLITLPKELSLNTKCSFCEEGLRLFNFPADLKESHVIPGEKFSQKHSDK